MVKKIHYIWLGGKKKPYVIKKCIKSWKKYMPDWEIIEWNEGNLNIDINKFCREAYDAKKYAFAADVLRFDVLLNEGGLYFDTDVKMLKSLQPIVEKGEGFTGYEHTGKIGPGLVLYVPYKNNEIIGKVLELYNHTSFINKDGSYNLKVVGDYFEEILSEYGKINAEENGKFGDFRVYTTTYFCPRDGLYSIFDYSTNTYTEHLYAASWNSSSQKMATAVRRFFYIILRPSGMKKCKELISKVGIRNFSR